MSGDYVVMAGLIAGSALLLIAVVSRDKMRESLFLFVSNQSLAWPLTIFIVFIGSQENPVRLFPKATSSNFLLAFVFFPAIFVVYYWHYPRNRSRLFRIAYTLAVTGLGVLVHVVIQKYTNLLLYITWTGYKLWLMNVITYCFNRMYADWYLGRLAKERTGGRR